MGTKRERELEAAIRNALEQTVMLESYPRSMISVSISVLQNDGAVLPACINAASLALVNAGIPMKELLVACSAGYINATPLVDLTWNEAANAPEIILAVLAESQGIILLDMKSKLPLPYIEQLTILANQGCLAIAHVLKETIKNYAIVNTNSWNLC
jgi:exosome complex component RRP41